MSLFGTVVSKTVDVATSIGKAVKKSARKIKRVASDVLSGLTGKDGIISKAYSKVKSLGSLALSKVLPGYGDGVIQPLQAVTSSSQAAGGTQFVSSVSKTLDSVAGKTAMTTGGISEWFTEGFKTIGGKVKDGVSYVYDSTLEFFGMKEPQKVQDPGKWISDKAQEQAKKAQTSVTGFTVRDNVYDMTNKKGITDMIGQPSYPLSLQNQPLNLQYESAQKAGMDAARLGTAEQLGISPFIPEAETLANKGIVGSGLQVSSAATNEMQKMIKSPGLVPTVESGSSFMDNIQKYGPALLEGFAAGMGTGGSGVAGGSAGTAPRGDASNRSGIGGRGSAGGDFLSEAQRAFLEKQRRAVEQVG